MKKPIVALMVLVLVAGCSKAFWGGGATGATVGVVGAGAAYELRAKQQLKKIDEDLQAGRINQNEYDIRKDQIHKDSFLQ